MNHCPKCSAEVSVSLRYLTPGQLRCRSCRAALKVNQPSNLKWTTFGVLALVAGAFGVLADRGWNFTFAVVASIALAFTVWSAAQGEIVERHDPSFRQLGAALQAIGKSPGQSLAKAVVWFIQTIALVLLFMVAVAAVVIGANAA